LETATLPI